MKKIYRMPLTPTTAHREEKLCDVCGRTFRRGFMQATDWKEKTTCDRICRAKKSHATQAAKKSPPRASSR